MCGIYGLLTSTRSLDQARALMAKMDASIIHRGPDDSGTYFGRGLAFGMRRLSIIDLAGGHQPIPNEDKTVWAVCNGEIYNYRELRAELEKQGHTFRTHTDTEVIVHLYEEVGVDLFKRLRGMFAVAIWDTRRSRLILCRVKVRDVITGRTLLTGRNHLRRRRLNN